MEPLTIVHKIVWSICHITICISETRYNQWYKLIILHNTQYLIIKVRFKFNTTLFVKLNINAILILCFMFELLLCVCTWKDGMEEFLFSLYLPAGHLCAHGNVELHFSFIS
jgi:hypothetical protein